MTIYWEQCSICGLHRPTRTCTMDEELMVCPHCCFVCPRRNICPNPVWKFDLSISKSKRIRRSEAQKVLMDLLSKLERG